MPTPDQWYQVYLRQSAALERIAADVKTLAAGGGGGGAGGGDGTIPFLRYIGDQLLELRTALQTSLTAAAGEIADSVLQLADAGSSAAAYTAAAQIGREHVTVAELPAREDSVAGAIDRVAAAIAPDPEGDAAIVLAARTLTQVLKPFATPGSLTPAEMLANAAKHIEAISKGQESFLDLFSPGKPVTSAIEKLVNPVLAGAVKLSVPLMAPFEIPFRGILQTGITHLLDEIAKAAKAHPGNPKEAAVAGVLAAHRLGHAAHGIAIAAELHPIFHTLGFSQLAAAVVDLSGFAPLSQAALRPYIEAAIARPMRYKANEDFVPFIPNENVLADHVRRRTLDPKEYNRWLAKHGYDKEHRDRMVETVWRDPTIRDLALALEDAAVDEPWLLRRVRTAGYDDEDADQLTRGLVARANKASRERLRAQAAGAYAEGTIGGEEYEALLADVGLSGEAMRWERRAAELQRRRDAIKDALATYRTQYLAGNLPRDDYILAVDMLGVDPERQAAIIADADARYAPRIQAEEEAAVKAALTELRRELVPRYRQLYTLGLVGADEYQRMLEQAGITPTVAAQAVALDASRIRAAAAATGSAAAERQLAELLRERQQLAIARYRRGQLTDAQLAADLLAAGRPPDQVDVVVAQERLARIPILARPPAISADAVDRLTLEFRRQEAILDFRAGRLAPDELEHILVDAGRTATQAVAEVNYELARLPTPKP